MSASLASRVLPSGVVAVVGIAATLLVSLVLPGPMEHYAGELVVTAFIAAAVPAGIGLVVLGKVRRRSVQTQTVIVALVSVAGTASGVLVAASRMFLSHHDLDVLLVVSVASATVGILVALTLGRRVGRAAATLTETTRRIAVGELGSRPAKATTAPEEFERLASELGAMQGRLAAGEQSRRELVSWISHDLRTPLAGIRALVEALEDGVVQDVATVARYHRTIREQTERIASLVDDLFEVSRLQAGAVSVRLEVVGLGDLVSDAVASVSAAAERKGVRVRGDVADAGAVVAVSTREIGRALQNLLDNAVRHTPPGGEVTVVGVLGANVATIAVTDEGGGVAPDAFGRIFEAGYTGDRARSGGGFGLGLAIARGFAEAHNGTLEVANTKAGATFTLALPRRHEERTLPVRVP